MTTILLALALTAPGLKESPKKVPPCVGTWMAESISFGGMNVPAPKNKTVTLTANGRIVRHEGEKDVDGGTFKVDLSKKPFEIDVETEAGPQGADFAWHFQGRGRHINHLHGARSNKTPNEVRVAGGRSTDTAGYETGRKK